MVIILRNYVYIVMGSCLCVYIAMCDYFCFVFIDLINNCNGFYENCLHNGFSYELLVCDGFFMHIVAFFSIKKGYVYV